MNVSAVDAVYAGKGASDDRQATKFPDAGVKRFELITYAGEVR